MPKFKPVQPLHQYKEHPNEYLMERLNGRGGGRAVFDVGGLCAAKLASAVLIALAREAGQ
jgi:hypothetical protein